MPTAARCKHSRLQVMEGALEVWDYSRYNIENYGRRVRKTQPRLQYLPFSFLSTKAQLPLGELPHTLNTLNTLMSPQPLMLRAALDSPSTPPRPSFPAAACRKLVFLKTRALPRSLMLRKTSSVSLGVWQPEPFAHQLTQVSTSRPSREAIHTHPDPWVCKHSGLGWRSWPIVSNCLHVLIHGLHLQPGRGMWTSSSSAP